MNISVKVYFFFVLKHMVKYRYLPFTHGKPKYQGHEEPGPKWPLFQNK